MGEDTSGIGATLATLIVDVLGVLPGFVNDGLSTYAELSRGFVFSLIIPKLPYFRKEDAELSGTPLADLGISSLLIRNPARVGIRLGERFTGNLDAAMSPVLIDVGIRRICPPLRTGSRVGGSNGKKRDPVERGVGWLRSPAEAVIGEFSIVGGL